MTINYDDVDDSDDDGQMDDDGHEFADDGMTLAEIAEAEEAAALTEHIAQQQQAWPQRVQVAMNLLYSQKEQGELPPFPQQEFPPCWQQPQRISPRACCEGSRFAVIER